MSEHTPLPWKLGFDDGSGANANDEEGAWITTGAEVIVQGGHSFGLPYGVLRQEDAEYIVRACNFFPDLVAALEGIANPAPDGTLCWCFKSGFPLSVTTGMTHMPHCARAREVLARARGEQP